MARHLRHLTLLLAILIALIEKMKAENKQPNIIFILADDLGWNDVGFHGNTEIPTPNIDALAADGIILNNYYVAPLCTPSRAALMTGLYPANVGLQNNVIDDAGPWGLPLQFDIFPEYMKGLGYSTQMVGKWHLGFFESHYTPTYRGFDEHYGFWGSATDMFHHTGTSNHPASQFRGVPESEGNKSVLFVGLDFRHDMKPVTNQQERFLTDVYTEKVEDVLKHHNKSKPLFLYLAHHGVHRGNWLLPVRAPPRYTEGFDFITNKTRQQFAGAVTALDESIGNIIRTLYEEDMLDNTIIAFSTDNGGDQMTFTSNAASNWPLRGQKFTCWEGGTRGVGFIWSPLLKTKGRVSDQMMHITDWLPTLYAAAGGECDQLGDLDGYDMWEALSEDQPSPRNVTLINVDPVWEMGAVRVGDYKLLSGSYPGQDLNKWYGPSAREAIAPPGFRDYSLVADILRDFYDDNTLEFKPEIINVECGPRPTDPTYACNPVKKYCLFNIKDDPCEYYNLANKDPKMAGEMFDLLLSFNRTSYSPLNTVLSFKADPLLNGGMWAAWADSGTYY